MQLIYKTHFFTKWQKKSAVKDVVLIQAINEIKQGLVDADLGGSLFKKRVARPGFGKRSGYRTLIATNLDSRWFFVFGFAKNEQDNVDASELLALQKYAKFLLGMTEVEIRSLLDNKELTELKNETK